MNKFFILLKKEVKELLTMQMILPMVLTMVLFAAVGGLVGKESKKVEKPTKILVVQLDDGAFTNELISTTKASFDSEITYDADIDKAITRANEIGSQAIFIFPENFSQKLAEGQPAQVESYYIFRNFSLVGSQKITKAKIFLAGINEQVSNYLISQKTLSADPTVIKNPIMAGDHVVVGEKTAAISPDAILGFVTQQTTFIPIILFIIIIMAAQMIATSVSSEKENKTLETLLSIPISRQKIVAAKLIGAGIVALVMAGVYMVGFRYYIDGMSAGQATTVSTEVAQAAGVLGLKFAVTDYLFLGGSLFFGILSALSIAMILGIFAEDTKAVQGVITPLMILVMIPYLLTLLVDFNSLSPTLKYIVYAIPFSHSFLAAPNIFLKNYQFVLAGIGYQFVFFLVFVYIAGKIFSTDKVMTIKLNFSKKKS